MTHERSDVIPAWDALEASRAFAARLRNIALTAQVQAAYGSAVAARDGARQAASCIARTWPESWLRDFVVETYLAQAGAAQRSADEVLASARAVCGLAYARDISPVAKAAALLSHGEA
ncbi:MAG TPA: hypothetical protein VMU33_04000 [Burkholderiaceae bacterium]|nr:hypothetical protein [Burkholderiaceae bacterium]